MGYNHFSLAHEIAIAAVRGVVYAAERHLFRGMGLSEIVGIGVMILLIAKLMTHRRPTY